MRIRIAGPLVALVFITNAGCINMLADPLGRRSALKEVQLKYTQAIRWGNIEKASEFVTTRVGAKVDSAIQEGAARYEKMLKE